MQSSKPQVVRGLGLGLSQEQYDHPAAGYVCRALLGGLGFFSAALNLDS